jgi:hypothetical protein
MTLFHLVAFRVWKTYGDECCSWSGLVGQLLQEAFTRGLPKETVVRRIRYQYPHPVTGRTICEVHFTRIRSLGSVELSRTTIAIQRRRFRCPFCRRADLPRHVESQGRIPSINACAFCATQEPTSDERSGEYGLGIRWLLASCRRWNWPQPFPVVNRQEFERHQRPDKPMKSLASWLRAQNW